MKKIVRPVVPISFIVRMTNVSIKDSCAMEKMTVEIIPMNTRTVHVLSLPVKVTAVLIRLVYATG
jgi:hypothetical protein